MYINTVYEDVCGGVCVSGGVYVRERDSEGCEVRVFNSESLIYSCWYAVTSYPGDGQSRECNKSSLSQWKKIEEVTWKIPSSATEGYRNIPFSTDKRQDNKFRI